jgi:hypothetical protein
LVIIHISIISIGRRRAVQREGPILGHFHRAGRRPESWRREHADLEALLRSAQPVLRLARVPAGVLPPRCLCDVP